MYISNNSNIGMATLLQQQQQQQQQNKNLVKVVSGANAAASGGGAGSSSNSISVAAPGGVLAATPTTVLTNGNGNATAILVGNNLIVGGGTTSLIGNNNLIQQQQQQQQHYLQQQQQNRFQTVALAPTTTTTATSSTLLQHSMSQHQFRPNDTIVLTNGATGAASIITYQQYQQLLQQQISMTTKATTVNAGMVGGGVSQGGTILQQQNNVGVVSSVGGGANSNVGNLVMITGGGGSSMPPTLVNRGFRSTTPLTVAATPLTIGQAAALRVNNATKTTQFVNTISASNANNNITNSNSNTGNQRKITYIPNRHIKAGGATTGTGTGTGGTLAVIKKPTTTAIQFKTANNTTSNNNSNIIINNTNSSSSNSNLSRMNNNNNITKSANQQTTTTTTTGTNAPTTTTRYFAQIGILQQQHQQQQQQQQQQQSSLVYQQSQNNVAAASATTNSSNNVLLVNRSNSSNHVVGNGISAVTSSSAATLRTSALTTSSATGRQQQQMFLPNSTAPLLLNGSSSNNNSNSTNSNLNYAAAEAAKLNQIKSTLLTPPSSEIKDNSNTALSISPNSNDGHEEDVIVYSPPSPSRLETQQKTPEDEGTVIDASTKISISANLAPGAETQPEVDIVINNVVCSFSVRCHLNLRDIALNGSNVEYRRENGMVTMKLRRPYTTASIWSSGRITCTGATSEAQAKIAARRYARCLGKLGFPVHFQNFRIVNVLGTCSMPWAIKIVNFSEFHRRTASYEPELHPGVTYKMVGPKATLKIFSTGSITVTAASVSDVQSAIERIYHLVYEFRKKRSPEELAQLRHKQKHLPNADQAEMDDDFMGGSTSTAATATAGATGYNDFDQDNNSMDEDDGMREGGGYENKSNVPVSPKSMKSQTSVSTTSARRRATDTWASKQQNKRPCYVPGGAFAAATTGSNLALRNRIGASVTVSSASSVVYANKSTPLRATLGRNNATGAGAGSSTLTRASYANATAVSGNGANKKQFSYNQQQQRRFNLTSNTDDDEEEDADDPDINEFNPDDLIEVDENAL